MRSPCTAMKSSPRLPQLEKAHMQQRRPNTTNKFEKKKSICDKSNMATAPIRIFFFFLLNTIYRDKENWQQTPKKYPFSAKLGDWKKKSINLKYQLSAVTCHWQKAESRGGNMEGKEFWGSQVAADLKQCPEKCTPWCRRATLKYRCWKEAPVSRAEIKQKLCLGRRLLDKVQKVWKAILQWQISESASKHKAPKGKGTGKCKAGFRSFPRPSAVWGDREVWPHRENTQSGCS